MIHISKHKCVGCGMCIEECAINSITLVDKIACINQDGCTQCRSCIDICLQSAIMDIDQSLFVAIATDDGKTVKSDSHAGMSKYFQVWAYENGEASYREMRENVKYKEDESIPHGDPGKARATASVLEHIDVLVATNFGPNIARLKNKLVCAVVRGKPTIAEAVEVFKENINEIVEQKYSSTKKGIVLSR